MKPFIDKWLGTIAPYEDRRIQYRFKDPEVNSAYALHVEGRSDEARTRINAALTANPSNAEALYYLGRVDLDQRKYDDAVTHLKEAAKLDAKLPDVWSYMAMAYLGLGQPRNAMDALQRISASASWRARRESAVESYAGGIKKKGDEATGRQGDGAIERI